jgi:hypothetical protein
MNPDIKEMIIEMKLLLVIFFVSKNAETIILEANRLFNIFNPRTLFEKNKNIAII